MLNPDSLQFLSSLIEAMPAGIMVYDEKGSLLKLNLRAREVLGETLQEVSSLKSLVEHMSRNVRESGDFPGFASQTEVTFHREHRPALTLSYSLSPFFHKSDSKTYRYSLVLFQDITEKIQQRKELVRSLRVGVMSRLLPTLAHEIKNPLASIQSIVEVVREELEQEQHREDMELVLQEISRLRIIIDRMRLAEQDLQSVDKSVDLEEVTKRALRLVEKRADALAVQMKSQVEPIMVRIHPEMFHMILLNLLNNSLDACQKGGRIFVSLKLHNNNLTLCVTDNGRGMPSETLRKATEPFFTTKNGGSGIGLALVQEIVSKSGGSLTIWSQESQGTRVTIELKVKR
jgi:PAS domain S-box-containing protein